MKSSLLLINPPFNLDKENYNSSIPIGLLSIASYLKFKGYSVAIIDGVRQKDYLSMLAAGIKKYSHVGLSVMTMQIPAALNISKTIRELNPNCKIVWGGVHPTLFTKETIAHELVDIVAANEGELVLEDILAQKEERFINGIAYKLEGAIKINPPRELLDPRKMPSLNWDLLAEEILNNINLVPTLSSRGCPHRCTFCINVIVKNHWRPRTVQQVIEDIKIIKQKKCFQNKKMRFWDENFFVDIKRAKQIIQEMIANDLIIPWETTIRANYLKPGLVDDDFLELLKKSGCYLLSFGAESGSPEILKKIKKDITPEDVLRAAKMCLKHNIIPQYSFMIGLPGETKKDMYKTLFLIDKLLKLSDKVQILGPQAFRPYPGSELYQECLSSGWRAPNTLKEWAALVSDEINYLNVQNYPWLKDKDFVESMEAYVRFGAHSLKSSLNSTVKANKLLKLIFIIICKIRWFFKIFIWPVEFKLAKKYLTK